MVKTAGETPRGGLVTTADTATGIHGSFSYTLVTMQLKKNGQENLTDRRAIEEQKAVNVISCGKEARAHET